MRFTRVVFLKPGECQNRTIDTQILRDFGALHEAAVDTTVRQCPIHLEHD